ncbi:phosphopantetheine-binding protein [Streptomyces sulphureus]|uniref:phosphopantetheine-binding protein n=1 Tax=Streptomyces sulphureus TaxID=47758 RepID=UPI000369F719|nr:phosphopantetheine-binding protein [Streptomyces sulphureus]
MTDAWDEQFEEALRSVLPHMPRDEPLLPETDLARAGLDSMTTVELLLLLEESYRISVPDELLRAATFATAGSLWQAIADVLAGDAA